MKAILSAGTTTALAALTLTPGCCASNSTGIDDCCDHPHDGPKNQASDKCQKDLNIISDRPVCGEQGVFHHLATLEPRGFHDFLTLSSE